MKKIILLLAVFAGLAAFVYFYEIEGQQAREEAEQKSNSLLGIDEAEISAFEIDPSGKEPILISQQEGDWRIVQPVKGSIDRFAVDAFLRSLAQAAKTSSFEQAGQKLDEYGLADPKVVVKLTLAHGAPKTLKLGNTDYTGNQVYALLEGDSEIHLTPKSLLTAATRDLKEWRSKSVLDFDQDKVGVFEIRSATQTVRVAREGKGWKVEEPFQDVADDQTVSSLLSGVKYSRIDRFVAENDQDLAGYGLDKPAYTLRLREQGEEAWKVLEIGKQINDGYYARNPDRPLIFSVRKDLVEKLAVNPDDLRDRSVVNVSQDELQRFQLIHGDVKINVIRNGPGFSITYPDDLKGSPTPPFKFWYPITDIKFDSIEHGVSPLDDPRFKAPDATLEVTLTDGSVKRFEFVQMEGKGLARQVETGRVGQIPEKSFVRLKAEPKSFVE